MLGRLSRVQRIAMKTENNGTGSEKVGEGESEVGRPEIVRHLRRPSDLSV